jgi:hypothetical protein
VRSPDAYSARNASTGFTKLARRGKQAPSTAAALEDCHGCCDQELVLGGDLISYGHNQSPLAGKVIVRRVICKFWT